MKTLLPLVFVLAVWMVGPFAVADEAADKAQVTELEKRCAASLVNGDFQALGSIFAEQWILVSEGKILTRQEVFADLRSGDLKFTSYELGELDVRIFGDTAIVVGHGNPHGEARGEKFEENEIFSDTFVRMGGQWRCIMSHSSVVE